MEKIVPICTDRFCKEPDKGKAIGRMIDEHNAKVARDHKRRFRDGVESISRYVYKKVTRHPKHFFFGGDKNG